MRGALLAAALILYAPPAAALDCTSGAPDGWKPMPKHSSTGGDDKRRLAADLKGYDPEPGTSIAVQSPVTLEVKDKEGRVLALAPDGEVKSAIPGAEAVAIPKQGQPGYEWYVALPPGKHDVTVTGIADGSFKLRARPAKGNVTEYPPVDVTKGAVSRLSIDDVPGDLITPKGEHLRGAVTRTAFLFGVGWPVLLASFFAGVILATALGLATRRRA